MVENDSTPTKNESASTNTITRRGVMKATAGAGALALGAGTGFIGSAAGGLASFDNLTVTSDNRIVNESNETFKMRGLNIIDPRRMSITTPIRGKTPQQTLDMLTNNERGWYPRVIRVPAQPADIGEHPNGHAGPVWEASELTNPDAILTRDEDGNITRRKKQPAQPVAFTQSQLDSYLTNYYDPIVQRCKERGVYCIVDYHRHWHEQPPGSRDPSYAENHLPYDSPHTNYWAYCEWSGDTVSFDQTTPASWGWVDMKMINEETPEYDGWAGIASESDIPGTPYAADAWHVNQDLVDEAVMFWDTVAQRYADEPHVIFEAYNEPTSPGIWGPAQGCGAIKQHGLWDVFLDDFMGPILDTIRTHQTGQVVLCAPMGWAQSLQALNWRDFNSAGQGHDNLAAVWHNYAGHDVSQVHHWLNDTQYESLSSVESQTGETLDNPFLPVATSVTSTECWGWEAFQAQGLQNAMDFHPVVVTEFGWIDNTDVSRWLRGNTSGQGTTTHYGEPFLDAMESDDRISWVAWCADARWLPKMFEVSWNVTEGELPLTNDNWYETDISSIPDDYKCPNTTPCQWNLLQNPHSGQHIKDRLANTATDLVPFATEPVGTDSDGSDSTDTCTGAGDLDGDGLYMDINCNGRLDNDDVVSYFEGMNSSPISTNVGQYDYNGNGRIDFDDLVTLFEAL